MRLTSTIANCSEVHARMQFPLEEKVCLTDIADFGGFLAKNVVEMRFEACWDEDFPLRCGALGGGLSVIDLSDSASASLGAMMLIAPCSGPGGDAARETPLGITRPGLVAAFATMASSSNSTGSGPAKAGWSCCLATDLARFSRG